MTFNYRQKLPIWLTIFRILMILPVIVAFYTPRPLAFWISAALYTVAGYTDFFDGYLARRWNASSSLGQFLDPIADKLMAITAILMLVAEGRAPFIPALVILLREVFISGLREFLAQSQIPLPSSKMGKVKTFLQLNALGGLIWAGGVPADWHLEQIAGALLWVAAVLTVTSGYTYLRIGLRHMI